MSYPPPDIRTENLEISFYSDLYGQYPQDLIGRTIKSVKATEHWLEFEFGNGTKISIRGHNWEDSPLEIKINE
jgi:hypothetical protein